MTLILTLIRPGEGIWQTVDSRVTRGGRTVDEFAPKQLSIHRWDGTLLLGYTGLAAHPRTSESTFDWIRSTLRGETRTADEDVLHLIERLNRDMARWREPLDINIAGVLGTRPDLNTPLQNRRMARWIISNVWSPNASDAPRVQSSFIYKAEFVDRPIGWSGGSGSAVIQRWPTVRNRLLRAMAHRPNKQLDYLGLLASVNRLVAARAGGTVSPWCWGTYMPEIGQELRGIGFSERGDPEGPPVSINSILFGIDQTDSTRDLALRFRIAKQGGDPGSLPPFDPNSAIQPRP